MQDFERGQKLVAEIGLPPPDAGERRGRADHRAVAAERAVVRLHAPDRGDDVAVDAIGLLDLVEHRLVLGQQFAAAGDALVVHQDVEIVPERLGELRLRVHQIHDAQVGREAAAHACRRWRARRCASAPSGHRPSRHCSKFAAACADRARLHQRMAGRARLAGPFARRRRRGRDGRDRRLRGLCDSATAPRPASAAGVALRKGEPGRAEQQRAGKRHQANRSGMLRHCSIYVIMAADHAGGGPVLAAHWGKIWLSEG